MFITGIYKEKSVDNTSDVEITAWLNLLKEINPKKVMIYTIDRDTPEKGLQKVSSEKLHNISDKVKNAGFDVSVSI